MTEEEKKDKAYWMASAIEQYIIDNEDLLRETFRSGFGSWREDLCPFTRGIEKIILKEL